MDKNQVASVLGAIMSRVADCARHLALPEDVSFNDARDLVGDYDRTDTESDVEAKREISSGIPDPDNDGN